MSFRHYPRDFFRLVRRSFRSFFGELIFGKGSPFGYALDRYQRGINAFVQICSAPVVSEIAGVRRYSVKFDSPYPAFNPSIERGVGGDGFVSMVRCTNIIKVNDGDNRVPNINSGERHQTVNYLVKLDDNLDVVDASLVDDKLVRGCAPNGLEDVRLFWVGDRLMGVGAGIDKSGGGRTKVCQVVFSLSGSSIDEFYVAPNVYGGVEKNWVPLPSRDGKISFIPSFIPIGFIDFDFRGFSLRCDKSHDFSVRGGTPLIAWGDGYLGIVHTPPMKHDGVVYYMHKLVLLDSNFMVREFSRPFFFQRRGIEFACGLIEFGEDLIVSYGVSDRSSSFVKIPKSIIRGMLGE